VPTPLDLREPFTEQRAKRRPGRDRRDRGGHRRRRVLRRPPHEDPAIRRKKHDFMLRVMDTAVLLGVSAVTGFVGRNQSGRWTRT
jgi:hypothetical protein